MKDIKLLNNPDIIEINGIKLQVIDNTSIFFDRDNGDLEMAVSLVKVGDKKTTPNYQLRYFKDNSSQIRFFIKKNSTWIEEPIKTIIFQ